MPEMTADPASWEWLADDELDEFSEDPRSKYMDRTAFVTATAEVIGAARLQSKSSTFGLIGSWGAGKTSIVSVLGRTLQVQGWHVMRFNPWLYSDADSLRWGFFSELRAAVPPGDKWDDTRTNIALLQKTVVPLAKLLNATGFDFAAAAEKALDQLNVSATSMREKVATQLDGLVKPVLVVIDDLDRLTSDELLEVFKLVRFIGRLPNIYYLLCYDETTLVDMLEKTDLVGNQAERRALDYLEKIVQLRFDIPPLQVHRVDELFEAAARGVTSKHEVPLIEEDETRLVDAVQSGITRRLDTPRAIKHYFAQLDGFLPSVKGEVNTVDFMLMSWVRTFEPELYAQILRNRAFFLSGESGFEIDQRKAEANRRARLDELLSDAKVQRRHQATVVEVLQLLFPAIRSRFRGAYGDDTVPRGIANRHYFDRYFNFGVPGDDLPDGAVRRALGLIRRGEAGPALDQLELELASEPFRTIEKLRGERDRSGKESLQLALWCLSRCGMLPAHNGWSAPRDILARFFGEVLIDVPAGDLPDVMDVALRGVPTAFMAANAARILGRDRYGAPRDIAAQRAAADRLRAMLADRLPSFARREIRSPVFVVDNEAWRLLALWEIVDEVAPKAFIRERVENHQWQLLDVVARLATSTVPVDDGQAIGTLQGFDPAYVSKFLDLDLVETELAMEIASASPVEEGELEATPENRRAFVLDWFRRKTTRQEIADAGT